MNNKLINNNKKNHYFVYHIFDWRKKVGIFFDLRSDPDPKSDPDQNDTDPQHW